MITISPRWAEPAVTVVFASDAFYVPYLAVAIFSLIAHSSPSEKYDVIILSNGQMTHEEEKLKSMCAGKENVSIRCIDMTPFCEMCESFGVRNHLSTAAYYRLFISSICAEYDKILYMDCDVLCHADVAALYHMDLGDKLVAAAYDRPIQDVRTEWLDGARTYIESIGMKDAKQCFNSGVLVMNLKQMRVENTEKEFLRIAAINKKYWHDQSVLNICCQDRVLYLPESWNFTTHMYDHALLAPHTVAECLSLIREKKYHIIHYAAGCIKPWQTFTSPLYRQWWEVAARTPYFDVIRQRTEEAQRKRMPFLAKCKLLVALALSMVCPTEKNCKRARRHMAAMGAVAADVDRWAALWQSLQNHSDAHVS